MTAGGPERLCRSSRPSSPGSNQLRATGRQSRRLTVPSSVVMPLGTCRWVCTRVGFLELLVPGAQESEGPRLGGTYGNAALSSLGIATGIWGRRVWVARLFLHPLFTSPVGDRCGQGREGAGSDRGLWLPATHLWKCDSAEPAGSGSLPEAPCSRCAAAARPPGPDC